jgi:hypothetical protein
MAAASNNNNSDDHEGLFVYPGEDLDDNEFRETILRVRVNVKDSFTFIPDGAFFLEPLVTNCGKSHCPIRSRTSIGNKWCLFCGCIAVVRAIPNSRFARIPDSVVDMGKHALMFFLDL